MNNNLINSKVNQKSTQFFVTTAFFLLFAVFSINLQAAHLVQDDLRNTVYGSKKPKPPSAKKTTVQNINTKKTFAPKFAPKTITSYRKVTAPNRRVTAPKTTLPSRRATALKKTSRNPSVRPLVTVNFTAQQPNSEIWLNDKNVGLTDKNSVFSKRLSPNAYRVMVKKGNQVIFPPKTINVSVEQTNFKLFNETVVKKIPESGTIIIVPEQKKKPSDESTDTDKEASAKVREVLENYADPSKTDLVTREDWELVYKSAQLGHLQDFTVVQIEAQRWFASGQIELANQNYNYAFAAFKRAIEFMPKSALPFYGLGNTYLADNRPAEALKALQQAIGLEPKMAMTYKKIGDAQRLLKNKKEAIIAYKNAIQLGYTAPETRYWLGVMLLENERTKEGLQQLEQLAESAPTAEIYVAIGDAYGQLKQNVSAVESYRKAIESKPDLAVAYFKLGNVYLNEREYAKAKKTLEKAVELDPDGKTFNRLDAKKKIREATSKIK
jgi:tetratricopeptide (TPR) repeat protein